MNHLEKLALANAIYPGSVEKIMSEVYTHLSVFFNGRENEFPERVSDKRLDPSMPVWISYVEYIELLKASVPNENGKYTRSTELKAITEKFLDDVRRFAVDFLCPDFGEGETLALPDDLEPV